MFARTFSAAVAVLLLANLVVGEEMPQRQSYSSPRQSGPAQVIARGGFPTLQPRSAESSTRIARDNSTQESESTYRVGTSSNPTDESSNSEVTTEIAKSNTDFELSPPAETESSRSKMVGPLITVGSSLAIVLALFCGLVWVSRRFGGSAAASKPLPSSALQPLGHIMLDPRTKLMLIKCGRRILVVSQTASGITPITEVTHPDEVRELVASCSAEAREVFERTLRQIELEPARGFTDDAASSTVTPIERRPASRLFAQA